MVHPTTDFIFMLQVLKSGTVFHKLGKSKALVEVTPVFPDVGELLVL